MNIEQLMSLSGDNIVILEELYENFKNDPQSVTNDWAEFFREVETANGSLSMNGLKSYRGSTNGFSYDSSEHRLDSSLADFGLVNLLNAYRRQGHLAANLDPLSIHKPNREFIDKKLQALKAEDLEKEVESGVPNLGRAKVKEIIDWFEKTYCSSIGCEHYYLINDEEREWLQSKMEPVANSESISKDTALRIFEKLFQADFFENFLAKKFVGKKRFSLEGGESTIPLLDTVIEEAGRHDMEGVVIGMAHRGRLNVLVNTIQKPAGLIFAEFEEKSDPTSLDYGDVKYHLGYSNQISTRSGKSIHLSLAFNPSHLEAVDPVIAGSVRARQGLLKDQERSKWMPIAIHGDAAFAGQGVVAETLNLMNLDGYTVGGTFHIVINNQIGFTTIPNESRSTIYATDLAKGFQIPIFHVNGDDPEAVYRTVKLCMEYRQRFKKDVIIDLICYRRLGHNETDEPAFTQPNMYDIIRKHPKTVEIYEKQLLGRGDIQKEEIESIKNQSKQALEDSFNEAKENDQYMVVDTLKGRWSKFSEEPLDSETATKLLKQQIEGISKAITTVPEGFVPHRGIQRVIDTRQKMASGEVPMDWGFAEALSFGSILENEFPIRLAGQDSQRGTFSHRHAVIIDSKTNERFVPLNHISEKQAKLEVINSSLSEFSCLGFEYGYSLADPNSLVIWEAQFGDFANNAQVMFDQFLFSSEYKWHRHSGLVILLPHGYEGQGPEHSSARLERFLQACAADNIQVANCTTAAQYFHLLRRQILRNFRKPLIIMTPKSMLRLPEACSNISEITEGAFRKVIFDNDLDPKNIRKIIFCSGKVYYDIKKAMDAESVKDIALVRVEQLYPFPEKDLTAVLDHFKTAKEYVWAQEEPRNQGAWLFLRDRLEPLLPKSKRLSYVGRVESPSPAAGHMKVHAKELEKLLKEALG